MPPEKNIEELRAAFEALSRLAQNPPPLGFFDQERQGIVGIGREETLLTRVKKIELRVSIIKNKMESDRTAVMILFIGLYLVTTYLAFIK